MLGMAIQVRKEDDDGGHDIRQVSVPGQSIYDNRSRR